MKKFRKIVKWMILLVLIVLAGKWVWENFYQMLYPVRYQYIIEEYAEEYELEPALVCGVIKAESNFVYDAHSGVARGLMQITEETADWIAAKMPMREFDADKLDEPRVNIQMGCFYLRYLLDYYQDLDLALAAYNAGLGNVNSWLQNEAYSKDGKVLDNIPFKETREYVKRVKKYTEVYRQELQKTGNT